MLFSAMSTINVNELRSDELTYELLVRNVDSEGMNVDLKRKKLRCCLLREQLDVSTINQYSPVEFNVKSELESCKFKLTEAETLLDNLTVNFVKTVENRRRENVRLEEEDERREDRRWQDARKEDVIRENRRRENVRLEEEDERREDRRWQDARKEDVIRENRRRENVRLEEEDERREDRRWQDARKEDVIRENRRRENVRLEEEDERREDRRWQDARKEDVIRENRRRENVRLEEEDERREDRRWQDARKEDKTFGGFEPSLQSQTKSKLKRKVGKRHGPRLPERQINSERFYVPINLIVNIFKFRGNFCCQNMTN
ncbi:hypothetical protein FQR65_LT11745 [Abscondita terminalis]|nr:hypothetical protein FQR65_LT11745 [Abscondita terminalis]